MFAASGDRLLKRYVVAMPDLQEQQLSSQDDALILASDGLWDVLTNQDAAQCIKDIKVQLACSVSTSSFCKYYTRMPVQINTHHDIQNDYHTVCWPSMGLHSRCPC